MFCYFITNIPIYMNPFILEVQIFEFVHEIYVCDQQIYGASFFFEGKGEGRYGGGKEDKPIVVK